ncbi:putative TetR family transcriptional regulator [Gordonia hirsuta DSM 44140 = NBRC 16056]|uniref:Putative TetR family transcriptional regulator n=1 Tax=Gordonia hirsuta DSM 44140 = NBRC 16056 TaxID=1121927 RepID=L7L5X5_9ACTN|nr:putative TetR family transcriptional regulator [Gordonia hirsuta DSM 44140 = NBRC 16056]
MQAAVRAGQVARAARRILSRRGVARTSLRDIAAEARIPLGTLQYVFPSRQQLLRRVTEDAVADLAGVITDTASTGNGLEYALRTGVPQIWAQLVTDPDLQLMQYELTAYSLREPGQHELARTQYQAYTQAAADWCRAAAHEAGEVCAVGFDQLGRILLASLDGLMLQYLSDPDAQRAAADLQSLIDMLVQLADPRPDHA